MRIFICSLLAFTGVVRAAAPPVDFAAKIAPIFQEYCVECHGNEDPDSKFNLETHASLMKGGKTGVAVTPGNAQESLLVKFLEGRSGKEGKNQFMPPGKRDHLKPEEIALIRQWIDSGAPAPAVEAKPSDVLARVPKIAPHGTPKSAVRALAASAQGPNALLAVGRFSHVELVHATDAKLIRTLTPLAGSVNAVAFSADGQYLFAAAGDAGLTGVAYQFQVSDGKLVRTFEGHTDALYALALSPDGKTLATGSYDQKIKLWSLGDGKEVRTLKGHNGCVYALSFRPDGKILASASADRTIKLWDVNSGARLDTFSQPLKEQMALAFSPDGKTLVAGGGDNRLRLWNISEQALEGSNSIVISRYAHDGAILGIAFTPDGKTLISSAANRTIKTWAAHDLTEQRVLETQPDWAPALALLDDHQLITGRSDGTLAAYDLTNGAKLPFASAVPPTMPAAAAKPKVATKPELTRLEPRGLTIGEDTQIHLSGKGLTGARSVEIGATGVTATILGHSSATGLDIKISAPAGALPGDYDLTVVTPAGKTLPLKLHADLLPQRVLEKAGQEVTLDQLPINVWGALTEIGQRDVLRFHASKDHTMTLDLAVKRVESKAQTPRLELLDPESNQVIATNTGLDSGADPFLAFTAPHDGDYLARVSETTLEGSPDHVYRLSIGALPYVVGFWPLSISAHHVGTIHLVGYNLSQMDMDVPASPTGEITLPLPAQVRARVPLRLTVAELPTAPAPLANHDLAHAAPLTPPMVANGRLYDEARPEAAAVDYYSFEAQQGQSWVIETRAAMAGSPVDTKIEVLDAQGQRVPYLLLQAMRDSYINFRSVDAINPDLRLENWREMALNQYVYLNGDIIRIFRMPRGPDSGILFYADRGKRLSYFNSSATAHSLDEPCYIVEPHPVGTTMVPNGLPVFTLYYQNDDDPSRQLGQDSRLIFTAPATGRYHVRVSDTRGWSGDRYAYELTLREPKPSYTVALASGTTVNVAAGSGASLALRADRRDGFDGDITVTAENVPPGLFIPSPTVIQGGHNLANACLYARPDLTPGKIDLSNLKLTATAQIGAQTVSVPLPAFTSITVDPALPQTLFIEPDANGRPAGDGKHAPEKPFEVTLAPGSTVSVWLRVDRHGNDALVSMDVENLPHGVIVDNIGLNGVQIRAGENEREIFLACAPWVQEQDRYCQIIVGSARNDASRTGKEQTSFPVLLKVRKNATAGRTAQR